jgi:hypothetical protein
MKFGKNFTTGKIYTTISKKNPVFEKKIINDCQGPVPGS